MKLTSVSVAVATLFAAVSGRNIEFPEPTDASDYSSDGFSPKPTLAAVDVHELFRREKSPFNPDPANPSNDYSYLVAPDNTCGYIGGRIGAGYTCLSKARCIFALTTAGGEGYLGCCLMDSAATTCGYRAGCINSADYNSTCTDAGCKADVSISKCTDPEYPYCATITFSEGVRDYYCNSIEISGGQLASTTYRGEDDEREFSLLTDIGTSKSVATKASSSIPGPSPTPASATASTTASPTPTNTDTGGGGGSKTPTGAIVGGVVGGVAAIGLVGLAVFFFLRNKKKNKASTNVPPPYQAPPMQQQPGNGPGGYNAVPQNQQTYYDPKHPYPSPNTQYVQPNSAVSGGFFPVQDPSQHPSSPTVTDPRMSVAPTSPSPSYGGYQSPQHTGFQQQQQQQQPGFQPQQQNVIHEAPDTNVDSHRGQMHELA